MSILFKKKKWDKQPTAPAAVLLASDGTHGFGTRAVARAAALAGSDSVALLMIAKIYGTRFGMPVPGLMPTKQEIQERLVWLRGAVQQLERKGLTVDGQLGQTRQAARTIVRVARARGVRIVVIESYERPRWRRVIEGDAVTSVARSLRRHGIEVEVLPVTVAAATRGPSRNGRSTSATSAKP